MNNREPTISEAIYALGIKGGWKIKDGKVVKWYSEEQQPSDKEIQDKYEALKLEWTAEAYARTRRPLYPDIGDQLDDLYHAGVFSAGMIAKLKKVKDDNPK